MKTICESCSTSRPPEQEARAAGRRIGRLAGLSAMIACAAAMMPGCASLGVKPWDHDLLAEPAMQLDAYPLEARMDDHIYFSKEASSGGRSFAGGGCGCN